MYECQPRTDALSQRVSFVLSSNVACLFVSSASSYLTRRGMFVDLGHRGETSATLVEFTLDAYCKQMTLMYEYTWVRIV